MSTNTYTYSKRFWHISEGKKLSLSFCSMWHCFWQLVICMCRVHRKICTHSWILNENDDNNNTLTVKCEEKSSKTTTWNWITFFVCYTDVHVWRVHLADIFDFHHRPMYKLFSSIKIRTLPQPNQSTMASNIHDTRRFFFLLRNYYFR